MCIVDILVENAAASNNTRSRSNTNSTTTNRRAQDTLDTISSMRLGLNKKKGQEDRKGLIDNTNDWDQ